MIVPFSLRIFVADGDPDGLRVVERSNWIGKARREIADELRSLGVAVVPIARQQELISFARD